MKNEVLQVIDQDHELFKCKNLSIQGFEYKRSGLRTDTTDYTRFEYSKHEFKDFWLKIHFNKYFTLNILPQSVIYPIQLENGWPHDLADFFYEIRTSEWFPNENPVSKGFSELSYAKSMDFEHKNTHQKYIPSNGKYILAIEFYLHAAAILEWRQIYFKAFYLGNALGNIPYDFQHGELGFRKELRL